MANASNKPVVLADAQDNPGAGGTSDTTGLLAAMVRNGARRAVIAVMYDPEVAEQAHGLEWVPCSTPRWVASRDSRVSSLIARVCRRGAR